ncbi:MAG: cyclase family protein [Anaerolineae bacterium]|nr:cyclase family protein [Anaerolineae bacterium]
MTPPAQAGQMTAYGALPVPQMTPELISLIKTGTVYSLAVVWNEGIPVPTPMVPYTLSPRLRHGDLADIAPASAAAEVVTMAAHTGTHIDALCHIGEIQDGDVKLYSGENQVVSAKEHVTYQGQTHLSIADMPPIITRAVLVDIAGYKGVNVLPDGYVISAAEIQEALAAQKVNIQPGSAVLIRTGFHQHLASGNLASRDAIAGIGLEAAQWLQQQGMILIGADNMTVEAMPPMDHAVHRFLLVHHGITHLENLYLDELAAKRVYECLLIVTPLRLQGATGSWVHPIAIA